MPNDSAGRDPKAIWLNQPTEKTTMTLNLIRHRAEELHAKTRRRFLETAIWPLFNACFAAFVWQQFPQVRYTLQPLLAVSIVWGVAGAFVMNRGNWSAAMPGDVGFSAGLEFCRREIERRRGYFSRILLWLLGPLVLAVGSFVWAIAVVAGKSSFPKAMPFLILLLVWITAYFFVIRVRERRQLQREIDELNDIEKER